MSARVVFIGLDAAEATLLEQWAEEGALDSFSTLIREGMPWHLDNSLETLPGAIWPELVSGISCGNQPLYYHTRQLHSGEARVCPVAPEDVNPDAYFWVVASREGKRVAAIDLPQTLRTPGINGIQLCEWGLHDRSFEITSEPESLLVEIRQRFGDHTTETRLWAMGQGIPQGMCRRGGNVLDLAPTILDLLGVPSPAHTDGKSLMTKGTA